MSTQFKENVKSAWKTTLLCLIPIAIIVIIKVSLSPADVELSIMLKRLLVATSVGIPGMFVFFLIAKYLGFLDSFNK